MANLVWIGSIASVGWLTRRAGALGGDAGKALAEAAYTILYKRVAAPAFGISFICGVARLLRNTDYYIHAHWFHAKLAFAFVVIALHHVLGARARRVHEGSMQAAGVSGILTGALLASVLFTVALVVYQSSLVK
jgi:putative membrane protein